MPTRAVKKFGAEHALNMFAERYALMHAKSLYDPELLDLIKETIKDFHIYIVGYLPKLSIVNIEQFGAEISTLVEVNGCCFRLMWSLPSGFNLQVEGDRFCFSNSEGQILSPAPEAMLRRLRNEHSVNLEFEILYIGQAFGKDGSRNVLDRLKRHETLQKIAIRESRVDKELHLLMLEVVKANRAISVFSPPNTYMIDDQQRSINAVNGVTEASEGERTSIYEAALIRYFQPKYNKEFSDSFPSTNMKLLSNCYKLDLCAVIAEIYFDDWPFMLYSSTIKPAPFHMAYFDLHDDVERRLFYF